MLNTLLLSPFITDFFVTTHFPTLLQLFGQTAQLKVVILIMHQSLIVVFEPSFPYFSKNVPGIHERLALDCLLFYPNHSHTTLS